MADLNGKTAGPHGPSPIGPGKFRGPYRILVVDDNRDAADSMRILLKLMGGDVRAAFGGAEALEIAESFRPEVVLLDIGMPKMHGYDVARHLRGTGWGKNVVLLALTGWAREEDRRRTEECGFDAHIIKPCQAAELRETVEHLLDRRLSQA